jgi:hypothetical protein
MMALAYLTTGWTRAVQITLDLPILLPIQTSTLVAGAANHVHAKHQSVYYSTLSPHQWPPRLSATRPTWAPSRSAANSCSKKTLLAWSAYSVLKCSAPSPSARKQNAMLRAPEPGSWNAACLVAFALAASAALLAPVTAGSLDGNDAVAPPDLCLNCLPSRTMSLL